MVWLRPKAHKYNDLQRSKQKTQDPVHNFIGPGLEQALNRLIQSFDINHVLISGPVIFIFIFYFFYFFFIFSKSYMTDAIREAGTSHHSETHDSPIVLCKFRVAGSCVFCLLLCRSLYLCPFGLSHTIACLPSIYSLSLS
jgi:hypothetical protein